MAKTKHIHTDIMAFCHIVGDLESELTEGICPIATRVPS